VPNSKWREQVTADTRNAPETQKLWAKKSNQLPQKDQNEKKNWSNVLSNISNTRKSVSSGYPNTEKWVEKTRRSQVFLTEFEVFGYLMKHSFEFLIWLLKPFIILGGNSKQKFAKFYAN